MIVEKIISVVKRDPKPNLNLLKNDFGGLSIEYGTYKEVGFSQSYKTK